MSDHSSISSPPPELVQQWLRERPESEYAHTYIATQAARWGADQELDACCEVLKEAFMYATLHKLRAIRRPKPPSLKEQALAKTTAILDDPNRALLTEVREALELNRRALEALNG